MKLFKMDSTGYWFRVNQMSLTLEEFSATTALTGSVIEAMLGHAGQELRGQFESMPASNHILLTSNNRADLNILP